MADGDSRRRWEHTSWLLAMLYNVHRAKGRARRPREFNPFTRGRSGLAVTAKNIDVLKGFVTQPSKRPGKKARSPKKGRPRKAGTR